MCVRPVCGVSAVNYACTVSSAWYSARAARLGLHVRFDDQSIRKYEYRLRQPSTLTELMRPTEYRMVPLDSMPDAEYRRLFRVYAKLSAKTLFEEVYGPVDEIAPSSENKALSIPHPAPR